MVEELHGDQKPGVQRRRGTGFPAVSLPDATAIMQSAARHGRVHGLAAMAAYAGHATANSGPFRQKLAALRDWGFVTTTAEAVTITDAGMGIALPSSPETGLDIALSAFQRCPVFWRLYSEAAKGVPLYPGSIGNVAVTGHGVSVRARDVFIKSFIDSAVTVGLAEKLPNGEVKLFAVGPTPVASQAEPESPHTMPSMPAQSDQTGVLPPVTARDTRGVRQQWHDVGVTVVFEVTTDRPLTATAFMHISEVVTAIEALREVIRSGE